MILNISEVCVLSQLINYFIDLTYKVLYSIYILYLLYPQSQINLLIRKLVLLCPLTPSIYYTGGFRNRIRKTEKKIRLFLQKIMAVTLTR